MKSRAHQRRKLDNSVNKIRKQLENISSVKLRHDGNVRPIYRKGIMGARLGFAPYRPGCTWSMACIDLMAMGVPLIAPNIAWFHEFIPSDLLFKNKQEALLIANKLITDNQFWNKKSQEAIFKTKFLEPSVIAKKFLQIFKKHQRI